MFLEKLGLGEKQNVFSTKKTMIDNKCCVYVQIMRSIGLREGRNIKKFTVEQTCFSMFMRLHATVRL